MSFLFSIQGRFLRWQWWLVWLPASLLIVIGYIARETLADMGAMNEVLSTVMTVGFVVLLWASLAASVKRFHDLGMPGWWAAILLLPYVFGQPLLAVLAFVTVMGWCGCWNGTGTHNIYGPSPD